MTETLPKPSTPTERRSSLWYQRPAIIYFFGAGDPPIAIKIGMTTSIPGTRDLRQSVRYRQRQIQSANHGTIRLLGIICFDAGKFPARDAEDREQELHKRFEKLRRFKDNTSGHEWFAPSKELLDCIQGHKLSKDFKS
jgi:hypothetical protein